MALEECLLLELNALGGESDVVYIEIAFGVGEVEQVVVRVELEGGHGGAGESEAAVVLGLLQEDHLHLAVVEAPDQNYLLVQVRHCWCPT